MSATREFNSRVTGQSSRRIGLGCVALLLCVSRDTDILIMVTRRVVATVTGPVAPRKRKASDEDKKKHDERNTATTHFRSSTAAPRASLRRSSMVIFSTILPLRGSLACEIYTELESRLGRTLRHSQQTASKMGGISRAMG